MQEEWKTYRTRFVIHARQLTQPFSFRDANGREHQGRVGDYLVQSTEGFRIAPREIFDDIYVAMEALERIPSRSVRQVRPMPEQQSLPV